MTSPIQESAKQILADQLKQWGLDSLTNDLDRLIKQGLDAPAITIQLADTDAYKQRFKANEDRRKKGLAVLSPAEYVAAENSYRQVLRTYGLPVSFYDEQSDYEQFLSNDVAPDELNERAQIAQQTWLSADPGVKDAWRSFYGLSDGAAIASIIDPDRALPIVQRMANAARFGATATRNGLEADRGRLERLSDLGVTDNAVNDGFSKLGQTLGTDQKIADRFGTQFTQAEGEAAELEGSASAQRKRQKLRQDETALFQSKSAAESGALSRTSSGRF